MTTPSSELIGNALIGLMIAFGWIMNHARSQRTNEKLNAATDKLARIETTVDGPLTLLIREKALDKRRLASLTHDPLDIAAAEAAEAAVLVREDGKTAPAIAHPLNAVSSKTT